MELFDARGTRVDESDTFRFTPPTWWDEKGETNQGLRGRMVQIKKIITTGHPATVELKSKDKVFRTWLRDNHGMSIYFPVDWLTLCD